MSLGHLYVFEKMSIQALCLKRLKIEKSYDPAIPLLSIYPKKIKTLIWNDTYTSLFIAALFTIAKIWKKPKSPSIDEWIKMIWYIYSGILLSHKNGKSLPFATTRMHLDGIMLSEISQRNINNTTWFHLYVESKETRQMNKQRKKQTLKYREWIGGCQRRGRWGNRWKGGLRDTNFQLYKISHRDEK